MNSEQTKKKNTLFIITLCIGTILASVFSFTTLASFNEKVNEIANKESLIDKNISKQCVDRIKESDPYLDITERSGLILASKNRPILAPYEDLTRVSVGISACYGYRIKDFCMGDDCANTLQFSLERAK